MVPAGYSLAELASLEDLCSTLELHTCSLCRCGCTHHKDDLHRTANVSGMRLNASHIVVKLTLFFPALQLVQLVLALCIGWK